MRLDAPDAPAAQPRGMTRDVIPASGLNIVRPEQFGALPWPTRGVAAVLRKCK
jgi:hypothetical protein